MGVRRTLRAIWALLLVAWLDLIAFVGAALAMVPLLVRRRPVGERGCGRRPAIPETERASPSSRRAGAS